MARDDHELPMAGDADPKDDSLDPIELPTLNALQGSLPASAKDASQGQRPVEPTQQFERQTLADARPATNDIASVSVSTIELEQLGQYKLLAKLGQGGMGAVYKARHTKLDKLVALKVLPAERLQDAAVARFEREMRAVGKLTHENIVAAHDAGEINGTHYLVMELVQGVDLGSVARDQAPLPIAESCEIIRQAARGLQHAYENNLVHRDIKPSNLMLAERSNGPVVKILDMGLALLEEQHTDHPELTASGQIMGTIDYMPPEQAGDTHAVDIRADIYSLGATLYKLLTGNVPFHGPQYSNTVKKLMALATQDPPRIDSLREDLPEELVTIVHRMMARQPEDRYATPQQVADAVAPFAAGANLAALLEAAVQAPEATTQVKRLPAAAKADASVSVRSSVVDTQSQIIPGSANQPDLLPIAPPRPPRRISRGVLLAGAALPLLALLGVILLSLRTPHGEIVVELADGIPAEVANHLKIEVSGNGQLKVADAAAGWTIDVAEGKYQARLSGGADQFQLEQNQVTVTRGKQALLKVTLKPLPKQPAVEQHAGTAPMPEPAPQPMPQPMPPDTAPAATKPWQATAEQQAFFDHVAKLPVDEQAAAVADKLKEINPGYDGAFRHKVEDGQVTAFMCGSTHIVDLWPVRALPAVQELYCGGLDQKAKLTDLSPLQGLPLRVLRCGYSDVADLSPLRGMPLTSLAVNRSPVADLSPLRGMPLKLIGLGNTQVRDLSPLAGMPLEELNFEETNVADLTPLKGMRLRHLFCGRTAVVDLSPLQGMPLTLFRCDLDRIADISPLRGMKLNELNISQTNVSDISVLAGMPLNKLHYDVRLFDTDDFDLIRTLPLTHLNGTLVAPQPIQQTLAEIEQRRQDALAFAEETAKLPPEEQIKAVAARLQTFKGSAPTLDARVSENDVTSAILVLKDGPNQSAIELTPLMAFKQLKRLEIRDGLPYTDLSWLKFLPVEELQCDDRILYKNLATLQKMETLKRVNGSPSEKYLEYVAREGRRRFPNPNLPPISWKATAEQQAFFDHVAKLPVDEQAAAVAAKLKEINPGYDGAFRHKVEDGQVTAFMCGSTHIVDLWPVRALPALQELNCGGREEESKLSDLSPLQGLPLRTLRCGKSGVADLSPLRGMPLTELDISRSAVVDLSPLRGIPLKQIHVNSTRVQDISPLAGMPLEMINGDETPIKDLTPLKGMPLQYLFCGRTAVEDLSPLQGLPLKMFRCDTAPITDISPLRGMKLNELNISRTNVSDLSVLAEMPLNKLLYDVRLFDSDDFDLIETLPLTHLNGTLAAPEPAKKVLALLETRRQDVRAFAKATAQLPAAEQIKAVTEKLAALNDPYMVTLRVPSPEGEVTAAALELRNDIYRKPIDITPVMAFTQLKRLEIVGGMTYTDISCLQFLPLEELQCDDRILFKNLASLKKIETLKQVNGQAAKEALDAIAREGLNHFANRKSAEPEKTSPEKN